MRHQLDSLLVVVFVLVGVLACDSAEQRWSPFRFVKTVRFFDAIKLPFISRPTTQSQSMKAGPGFVLFSSAGGSSSVAGEDQWAPLDDVVMGGVSETNLTPGRFQGKFEGVVRTERNGGFAGIRTKLFSTPLNAKGSSGFRIIVRGDGQRYKFIARDSPEWNGIAWSKSFDTEKGRETTHVIKFSDLVPTKFARAVPDAGKFKQDMLSGLQITLSKFEYDSGLNPKFSPGPFQLNIGRIELI